MTVEPVLLHCDVGVSKVGVRVSSTPLTLLLFFMGAPPRFARVPETSISVDPS
jgi:hypothetical protein